MWGIHQSKWRLWKEFTVNAQSLALWNGNSSFGNVLFSPTLSLNRSKSGFRTAGLILFFTLLPFSFSLHSFHFSFSHFTTFFFTPYFSPLCIVFKTFTTYLSCQKRRFYVNLVFSLHFSLVFHLFIPYICLMHFWFNLY